jgi:uncharacterized membrane protein
MESPTPPDHLTISNVSAWVLRIGVISASLVMLIGVMFTFAHGTESVQRMKTDGFDYRPNVIVSGILHRQGKRIIEAGIYLLLLTPVMRVAASCLLFATKERDRMYTLITLIVLALTLTGLIWSG